MGESGAKVVIRGDAAQFIEVAKKVKKELDETGQRANSLSTFGDKMATSLAKSVAKALLLKAALSGAFVEANKLKQLDSDASRSKGKQTLDREIAGAQLGFTGYQTGDLFRGESYRSDTELTGFFTGLADKSRDKNVRGRLDPDSVARAMALYRSGLVSEGEVMDAIQSGSLAALEVEAARRRSKLTMFGAEELAAGGIENRLTREAVGARALRGMDPRLSMASAAAREARSPVSAGILNAVGEATSVIGGDAIVQNVKNRTDGAVLAELRMQTDEIRRQGAKPRLGTTAE